MIWAALFLWGLLALAHWRGAGKGYALARREITACTDCHACPVHSDSTHNTRE